MKSLQVFLASSLLISATVVAQELSVEFSDDSPTIAYNSPVAYTAPVVYEAPVLYTGPVTYLAPVIYASQMMAQMADQAACMATCPPPQCKPVVSITFIGNGPPRSNERPPCEPSTQIIIFGARQAAQQGYKFTGWH